MNAVVLASTIILLIVEVCGDRACSLIKCKKNENCVNRKFSCESHLCPRMIYCARNRKESLNGPSSCDNVKCSNGFICTIKVRHCSWETCREQIARCVTEMDFYEGPATCIGYKCSMGQDCILRESFCSKPPCKLFKACFNKRDVHNWLNKCKSIGCLSPHQCFLRKSESICDFSKCNHSPDCLAQTESELEEYDKCKGWICPRGQKCHVQGISHTCGEIFLKNDSKKEIILNRSNHFDDKVKNKTLLYALLENINNKSDVINFWVDQSRQNKNFPEFRQWLQTVRFLLGDDAFNLWLNQIKNTTEKDFHRWLPTADFKGEFWNSTLNPARGTTYETESLINPQFKQQSLLNYSSVSTPDQNLTLFYPKDFQFRRQELDTNTNITPSDYYLSIIKLIEKLLEAIAPVIEYNQQTVIKQLVNESAVMDDQKKISVIGVLKKLRDERQIYVHIINKTRELIAKAQPPVPSILIDEIIEKLTENVTSRRNLGNSDNSTVEIIATPVDDYPDNETEFFLVDYGESISDLKVNQSMPRIVVRIENNLQPAPRIGTVKVNYGSNNTTSGLLRLKDDYYSEDGIYDTLNRTRNKTNSNSF